ncbi:hypothetical protein HF086_017894 [Spodoptera exigua]|uniref:Sulfotransferase domain-containing protein n=1 Tax=Spodoptera exigua TaxID=7107 RepID=A0A922SFT3_SPOEX|nr:hypothetical protein HF086_017894 [Spodoptera exigua]
MGEQKDLPFPYDTKELDPEEEELINVNLGKMPTSYVKLGPKGYMVLKPYMKDAANIYNMPLRPTDVFVASYQRSDIVAETADENFDREKYMAMMEFLAQPVSPLLAAAPLTQKRFIKTHLPMSLMPPTLLDTAKVIYVARDPRDVAVSCYHHARLFKLMGPLKGFKNFWEVFYRGLFTLTPYFEHVKEAWEKRHNPNMLFLFYEELSKDLPAIINRVADFLGKELNQEQIDRLCDHLSIENFKQNKSVNFEEMRDMGVLAKGETFIRKGKSGGWRDYFDEEMTQQAERWIEENLKDTDLRFPTKK